MIEELKARFRALARNEVAFVGTLLVLLIIGVTIFAPWIAPYDPAEQRVAPPLSGPSFANVFGTDFYGRDICSRILHGARISITIGVLSILSGMIVGVSIGVTAGYKGGLFESIAARVADVLLSFPMLILGLLILAILGSGTQNTIIALAIAMTPRFYRLAYTPTISIKEERYIEAARAAGAGDLRILLKHVIPNIISGVLIMASVWVGAVIKTEAGLSFLGVGVNPPTPAWGVMISQGVRQIHNVPHVSVIPGLAILITILSFNLVGDGLRDMIDPMTVNE